MNFQKSYILILFVLIIFMIDVFLYHFFKGGAYMVLSNFISVMYECFGSKIFVDDYEIIKKSYNKADMLKGVLSKVIIKLIC